MDDSALADFLPGVLAEEQSETEETQEPLLDLEQILSANQNNVESEDEEEPPQAPLSVFDAHTKKESPVIKNPKKPKRKDFSSDFERDKRMAEEILQVTCFPDCVPVEMRFALVRKARVGQAQAVLKERQNYSAWQEAQRQRDLAIMRELNPRYAHRYQ